MTITKEELKWTVIFAIPPVAALILLIFQIGFGVSAQFNGVAGKVISIAVFLLSCISLHLLQGSFNQFSNLLTAAAAFYFIANVLPNFDMGYPVLRNAGNTADLDAADVAQISSRFLFFTLGLFFVLYLVFSLVGSDFAFLPSANNAYRRILKANSTSS